MQLEGKTAVVTGGRQGIGRAIADAFVAEGATVLTCGRGPRPDDLPPGIHWQTADVSRPDDVTELKTAAIAALGDPDIVVNNAGIQIEKTVVESTDDDWDALMGANAKGVFLMCREIIPSMSDGGSIINIGSISGNHADPSMALYNASKSFVHGLTRSIAIDHGPSIRCNAIWPLALTQMTEPVFARRKQQAEEAGDPSPAPADIGFGAPADVAKLVTFLVSDAGKEVNGQIISFNGRKLALWSHPREINITRRNGWSVEDLMRDFGATVGANLEEMYRASPT